MAPGTRGSRCADGGVLAEVGCGAREGDGAGCADGGGDGGGGAAAGTRPADHCGAAAWIPSVAHCRWSRGSPGRSSCHSPRPPDRRHPLGEKREEVVERRIKPSLKELQLW